MMSPILMGFLGTLFTYGMTAAGAAIVFLVPSGISARRQRQVLDAALGFAGGVMIAASCFGLLIPAMTFAEQSGVYGAHSYAPSVIGVLLGAAFVHAADKLIPHDSGDAVAVLTGGTHQHDSQAPQSSVNPRSETDKPHCTAGGAALEPVSERDEEEHAMRFHVVEVEAAADEAAAGIEMSSPGKNQSQNAEREKQSQNAASENVKSPIETSPATEQKESEQTSATPVDAQLMNRGSPKQDGELQVKEDKTTPDGPEADKSKSPPPEPNLRHAVDPVTGLNALERAQSWRRIMLLVIAIVIHNLPEGLAVGVGFGALSRVKRHPPVSDDPAAIAESDRQFDLDYNAVLSSAKALALGIGLQNFPEGLAVSLPLLRVGYSRKKSFMWGQLSGVVEPLGGVFGAWIVSYIEPLLPYALAFAAGAMIFVVAHDILPETRAKGGHPMLAVWFLMIGFCVMMSMDVALG